MDIFLADESVDYRIIVALRERNFIILSVIEINPGWTDNHVLDYCVQNDLILITEDKDFGELVNRFKKPNKGIILLRLVSLPIIEKKRLVMDCFIDKHEEFRGANSVLSNRKLRIRKYS